MVESLITAPFSTMRAIFNNSEAQLVVCPVCGLEYGYFTALRADGLTIEADFRCEIAPHGGRLRIEFHKGWTVAYWTDILEDILEMVE